MARCDSMRAVLAPAAVLLVAVCAEALPSLNVMRVDSLSRVYPDRTPAPAAYTRPISVPRGSSVPFVFAAMMSPGQVCALSVSPPEQADGTAMIGQSTLYELVSVHVEANTSVPGRTAPGSPPPPEWRGALVRPAPFDVAEVLVPTEKLDLSDGLWHAALVDVSVAPECPPGRYTGRLALRTKQVAHELPFSLDVRATLLEGYPVLDYLLEIRPDPDLLTVRAAPDWWSEEHWRLLEITGRRLRAAGQTHMPTPLINHEQPLIRVVRDEDGQFGFDFARFDRWMRLFLGLGFRKMVGHPIALLPAGEAPDGVYVVDKTSRKRQRLCDPAQPEALEQWLSFIPVFYRALKAHLDANGWTGSYIQQLGEPTDIGVYRRLSEMLRACMPGVPAMDATNDSAAEFSPLIDMQVFAVPVLAAEQGLAADRRRQGFANWFFTGVIPLPPLPNRHLDEPLTNSRLYPWMAFGLGAQGYACYEGNAYCVAAPYRASIAPRPDGLRDASHGPGGDWMLYPGPDGPRLSLRMLAFRDGLVDHSLLCLVAQRDPRRAYGILTGLTRSPADYETDPARFHDARTRMLDFLEPAAPPTPGEPGNEARAPAAE